MGFLKRKKKDEPKPTVTPAEPSAFIPEIWAAETQRVVEREVRAVTAERAERRERALRNAKKIDELTRLASQGLISREQALRELELGYTETKQVGDVLTADTIRAAVEYLRNSGPVPSPATIMGRAQVEALEKELARLAGYMRHAPGLSPSPTPQGYGVGMPGYAPGGPLRSELPSAMFSDQPELVPRNLLTDECIDGGCVCMMNFRRNAPALTVELFIAHNKALRMFAFPDVATPRFSGPTVRGGLIAPPMPSMTGSAPAPSMMTPLKVSDVEAVVRNYLREAHHEEAERTYDDTYGETYEDEFGY